jgi:transcriptional regulator with XRE-family HTH domain
MPRKALSDDERAQGRALGAFLLDQRTKAKIERRALARSANIGEETLRNLEAGDSAAVTFLVILRVSEALGINLNDVGSATHTKGKE